MDIKLIIGAACTCLAFVSFGADAALVGRLATTPGGVFQAYYDNDADLTWLADANAAGTEMNWTDANAWAAGLSVGGNDNWRLASALNADGSGPCALNPCPSSEMGNLFYNTLGGVPSDSTADPTFNDNYRLFSNVQSSVTSGVYWTATEVPRVTPLPGAYLFNMFNGVQGVTPKVETHYAWAVQSGDVSEVPLPAAAWLFGSGLIALAGLKRRKR